MKRSGKGNPVHKPTIEDEDWVNSDHPRHCLSRVQYPFYAMFGLILSYSFVGEEGRARET
jgi:hypothetical protein